KPLGEPAIQQQIACANLLDTASVVMTGRFSTACYGLPACGKRQDARGDAAAARCLGLAPSAVHRLSAQSWLRTSGKGETASNTRLPQVLSKSLKRFPRVCPGRSGQSMPNATRSPQRRRGTVVTRALPAFFDFYFNIFRGCLSAKHDHVQSRQDQINEMSCRETDGAARRRSDDGRSAYRKPSQRQRSVAFSSRHLSCVSRTVSRPVCSAVRRASRGG
ncbi:MAG: hypothetical protein CBCREVIR_2667, partial [Candidatus Burkholderia crenata]